MSSPRPAWSATTAPTALSSAATPSSCPKSGRSACSTRSTSTRVEFLAAAPDAGKGGLGAGIIAHVVGEGLVDMAIHLHRSAILTKRRGRGEDQGGALTRFRLWRVHKLPTLIYVRMGRGKTPAGASGTRPRFPRRRGVIRWAAY